MVICSLTRASAREAARAIDLPDSQIGTLHSLVYHQLGRPTIAEGKIREWNEQYANWALDVHGVSVDDPYGKPVERQKQGAPTSGDDLMQEMSKFRTRQIPRSDWPGHIKHFAERWDDWKQQSGYMDFTDLLETALTDIDQAPGHPAVLMLDEAQDVGRLEMALLQKWSHYVEHLVIAGDYHQSLFQWRGSDPEVMMLPGATVKVLEQSYRIPRAVLPIAMRWMARTKLPPVAYRARDFPGVVRQSGVTILEPELLARQLEPALAANKTIMLLVTCKYMLDGILRAFQAAGLPYHNPWRPTQGNWNPLAPGGRRGVTFHERVLAFLRLSPEVYGEEARFLTVKELKAWGKALPTPGTFKRGMKPDLERCPESMSDEALARKLPEWFTPTALEYILTCNWQWYCATAEGGAISKPLVERILHHRGAEALRKKPQVIVGTVHSLKGTEADHIYVFPDVSPTAYYSGVGFREEIARVFYVAISRTKEELVLCSPSTGMCVNW